MGQKNNPFPTYYVYMHIDPMTDELLYIGMGQGVRAYTFKTSKSSNIYYMHRSNEHSTHLETLISKGWLPHEWVVFIKRNCSKEEARKTEKKFIEELKPKYNRKHGLKQLKFNKKEIIKIKELREQGLYYSQIAKEMNCSQMVAHRIVNDLSPRYKELLYGE